MTESRELALEAARAASSKKAVDVVVMDMREVFGITDYFVICSGSSERQVGTVSEEVQRQLRDSDWRPYRREGVNELRWVLLDYVDIVVHVFHQEERDFYELERLWKDAPRVLLEEEGLVEEAGS